MYLTDYHLTYTLLDIYIYTYTDNTESHAYMPHLPMHPLRVPRSHIHPPTGGRDYWFGGCNILGSRLNNTIVSLNK